MSQTKQLSLASAILININIMLGAGIFMNTVELSKRAGSLSSLAYIIIGLLMLPLVISIAELTKRYPIGGFYAFCSNEINTFTGFISAWSYLIGKLASGALMVHFSLTLMQNLIPALSHVNILLLDGVTIACFVLLNMLNMQSGSRIQAAFTVLKLVPIAFVISVSFFLINGSNFTAQHQAWSNLPSLLPLLLYASMGFEAACLLSSKISNPKKNGPRAILISYGIVIFIATLYQVLFYGALGTLLASLSGYLQAFPTLLAKIFPLSPFIAQKIQGILHLALASSALGGSYGIMFSNTWNLHTLAHNGHVCFPNVFTWLNRHGIPVACVVFEGFIYMIYLLVTYGNQIPLQQISALGVVCAYTMSVIAFILAWRRDTKILTKLWIPILAMFNCILLICSCITGLMKTGSSSLATFSILLLLGAIMFVSTQPKECTLT